MVNIHECMQPINAVYTFTPVGQAAQEEQKLYDQQYFLRTIPLTERGSLTLKFYLEMPFSEPNQGNQGSPHHPDLDKKIRNLKKFPTVFNLRTKL